MRAKEEIERSIENNTPIVFGEAISVDRAAFSKKYQELLDSAIAETEPILGPETVHYQASLLFVALLFASMNLLKLETIKIGDTLLTVNHKLLVLYSVFIVALCVLFLSKVWIDVKRARFVQIKDLPSTHAVTELVSLGLLRKRIQQYFWLELAEELDRASQLYQRAFSADRNDTETLKSGFSAAKDFLGVDLSELRKRSESAQEISMLENGLAALKAELAADKEQFAKEIEAERASQGKGELGYRQIQKIHEKNLKNWLDAYNDLASKNMSASKFDDIEHTVEVQQAKAILGIKKKVSAIRRFYFRLEVGVPIGFALLSIATLALR
jgi:hypothetical protein